MKNWYYPSARQSTAKQSKAFFEKFRCSAIPRIALRITATIFQPLGGPENFNNAPPLPALQSKESSLKNSIYCSEHICSPPRKAKLLLSRKILSALRGTAEPSKAKMLEKLRKLYDSLPSAAVQSKAF